jgi:TPR repeat protein
MIRLLLCVLLLVASTPAAPAQTEDKSFRTALRAFNLHDYPAAYGIWRRLADSNDARAQASLGYMYYVGRGVPRSSQAAAAWFYRAANQGESTAQLFLAVMHYYADGVPKSLELSLMWCELAMAGGQPDALEWRGLIMEDMTSTEHQAAWRLVERWYRIHDRTPAQPSAADKAMPPEKMP